MDQVWIFYLFSFLFFSFLFFSFLFFSFLFFSLFCIYSLTITNQPTKLCVKPKTISKLQGKAMGFSLRSLNVSFLSLDVEELAKQWTLIQHYHYSLIHPDVSFITEKKKKNG